MARPTRREPRRDTAPPRASGLVTALSWLTVLPVRGPSEFARRLGRAAIGFAPLVGLLLGVAAATAAWALHAAGAAESLIGLGAVLVLALGTRGMHVDGFADTVDGLACYGSPKRVREVMKSGSVGPMGAAALVVVILAQSSAFGMLAADGRLAAIVAVGFVSRVSVVVLCIRGGRAASRTGFGALTIGTQGPFVVAAWSAAAVVCGGLVIGPGVVPAAGALAVAVVLVVVAALGVHCARRFGGLSGDVLGAGVEVSTALTAVAFALL